MNQWPSHRRRQQRRASRIVPALVVALATAAVGWLLYTQLRAHPTEPVVRDPERGWMSPGLFGVRSESSAEGRISFVDTHDSLGPIALIVGAPATRTADWSAVQALLERQGVASVTVVPARGEWRGTLRDVADGVLARGRRTTRPVVVVTFGSALDSLLAAAPVGHSLRNNPLVALAPRRPARGLVARLVARLSLPIRIDAADVRLGAWTGRALVVHSQDDGGFGADDARRMAAGAAGGAGVERLSGGGFSHAPQHPSDDGWRPVIEFVTGRRQARDVVVHDDAGVTHVDSIAMEPVPMPAPRAQPTPSLDRRP